MCERAVTVVEKKLAVKRPVKRVRKRELCTLFAGRQRRRKIRGQCVEPQLAVQIAACSGSDLIKPTQSLHDPTRVDSFGDCLQLSAKRDVAQLWRCDPRANLQEIGEQAIKNGKLRFERDFAIFRNRVGKSKNLPEFLAAHL